ncbi:unnamed protein product, partial [Prorocentrum cordatum]
AHAATPSSPSAEAPALPRRPPPEGSSCEVPDRVHAAQLLDQDLHAEFICRICTDLCQPGDFGLLPCSHIFCRSCLRSYLDWWKRKPQVDCPACRSPFSHAEVGLDETPPEPLVQWLANVAVRCVFAPADESPRGGRQSCPSAVAPRRGLGRASCVVRRMSPEA